jgi:hypothetical protein
MHATDYSSILQMLRSFDSFEQAKEILSQNSEASDALELLKEYEELGNNIGDYSGMSYVLKKGALIISGDGYVDYSKIKKIPFGITYFCWNNLSVKIPRNLPSTLTYFTFHHTTLDEIPDYLPNSITHLNCSQSPIQKIDKLPPNLEVLICKNCDLYSISNLPLSLKELHCSGNYNLEPPKLPPNCKMC